MAGTQTVNDDMAAAKASESKKRIDYAGFSFQKAVRKRQLGVALLRAAREHFDCTVEHIHSLQVIHSTISLPSKQCFICGV